MVAARRRGALSASWLGSGWQGTSFKAVNVFSSIRATGSCACLAAWKRAMASDGQDEAIYCQA